MKKDRCKWLGMVVLSLATLLVMGGCGGSSSSAPPQSSTAKISGSVSFPSSTMSLNNLVSKRAGLMVEDSTVTVEAYNLEGKLVGSAGIPEYNNAATDAIRVYSYSFAGLELNKDYVIKAKKNSVVLKKLIEKKDVVGNVVGQSINSVSTAAVIVASNKLGVVLGDVIPAGSSKTVAGLSTSINTEIVPVQLENEIQAVVDNKLAGVTDSNKAAFANVFNIVVTAGSNNINPSAMFTITPPALEVKIVTVTNGVAAAIPTNVTAITITDTAAPVYVPPKETAAIYNAAAKSSLTRQDIANAALNYEKALSVDANDAEANFGGAITSGMMLMEDADVQAIITKWGAVVPTVNQIVQGTSPIKLPFGNMTSIKFIPKTAPKSVGSVTSAATATAAQNVLAAFSALKTQLPQQKIGFKSLAKELGLVATTAPTISEMQTLIDNVIIPRIDKIIARLAKAETTAFSFTITAAMQGNPTFGTAVTLDAGELYTLDAALNIFQILFKIASSYNFDIPSGFTYDTIGRDPLAMINSTSFLSLKPSGSAQMASALINARSAAAKAKLAYDTLVARTAGVGMFDLTGWTTLEKVDFTGTLSKVTLALAGPYDLVSTSGTKTLNINAPRFFTNPLTRLQLPTFGYDVQPNATLSVKYDSAVAGERTYTVQVWNGTAYVNQPRTNPIHSDFNPTSDLPDYTLNGIFPNNTAANNFADFNGILPMLSGKLLTGSVDGNAWGFTTDGSSIYYLPSQNYSPGQTSTFSIKKIDTATGVVSTVASGTTSIGRLLWFNGGFYALGSNSIYNSTNLTYSYVSTISPVTITGSTFTVGSAVWTSPSSTQWVNLSAVASNGTDIYYAVSTWNQLTYRNSTDVRKLSNLTTDVSLVTIPDYLDSLAFRNGFLYTDGEKRDPALSYSVVASYSNNHSDVMVGGYFYQVNDGKLVKYAGTPAGGAAKVALAKYFGI